MCPHWKAGIFLSTLCSSLGSPHSGTAFLGFVLLQGKSIYLQSLTMGLQFLCCRINCIDQPSSAPVQPALLYNHKPLTAARPVLRLKESAVGIQPGLPIRECPKATKPPRLCGLSEALTGIWTLTDHLKPWCKSHTAGKKWWLFFARIWFLFLLNFNAIINILRDCFKNQNSSRICLGGSGLWKCSQSVKHSLHSGYGRTTQGTKEWQEALWTGTALFPKWRVSAKYQARALTLAESTDGHFHKCWALPLVLKKKTFILLQIRVFSCFTISHCIFSPLKRAQMI